MNAFFRSTNINLLRPIVFLCLSLIAFQVRGNVVALVTEVKGNVFVSSDGHTKVLKKGDLINDFAEILTEEGAMAHLSDYHNHHFHLAGGGHIKFLNKIVELKHGRMWIQSYGNKKKFMVQTANAQIFYTQGEGIVSYENYTDKTQVLAIKGEFRLENILNRLLHIDVGDGQFSFVHHDYNEGRPRRPTPIGKNSFKQIMSYFHGVHPRGKNYLVKARPKSKMKKEANLGSNSRALASIPVRKDEGDQGKTLYVKRPFRGLRPVNLSEIYQEKLNKLQAEKKKAKPVVKKKAPVKSNVKLRFFGASKSWKRRKYRKKRKAPAIQNDSNVIKSNERKVASIKARELSVKDVSKKKLVIHGKTKIDGRGLGLGNTKSFESSLMKQYKKQLRHGKDVTNLINDLKTYRQNNKNKY